MMQGRLATAFPVPRLAQSPSWSAAAWLSCRLPARHPSHGVSHATHNRSHPRAGIRCRRPAQTFEKKNYNYSKFAKGAFSEVVTVTGPAKLIWLAGIGSEDEDDGSVRHRDDFLAQCRFAWEKVAKLLKEHGATVSDIVKATSYVTDIRYRDEMRSCRTEVFTGVHCRRTRCSTSCSLPARA